MKHARTKRFVRGTDLLFRPIFTFSKYYFVRKAYRDGMAGFLVSALSSMYTFVKYAKLWHMRQLEAQGCSQETR